MERKKEEIGEAEEARGEKIRISPIVDIYETNRNYWENLSKIKDYLWFNDKYN